MKRFFLGVLASVAALFGYAGQDTAPPAASQLGQEVAHSPAPAQQHAQPVASAPAPKTVAARPAYVPGFVRFRGEEVRRRVKFGRSRWVILG